MRMHILFQNDSQVHYSCHWIYLRAIMRVPELRELREIGYVGVRRCGDVAAAFGLNRWRS